MDPSVSKLTPDGEENDSGEGLKVQMYGPQDKGKDQEKFVMDLICSKDKKSKGRNKDGDEGDKKTLARKAKRDDDDDDDDDDKDDDDKKKVKEESYVSQNLYAVCSS